MGRSRGGRGGGRGAEWGALIGCFLIRISFYSTNCCQGNNPFRLILIVTIFLLISFLSGKVKDTQVIEIRVIAIITSK